METDLKLPKKYLSYSQLRLWLEDKNKYRDRYYKDLQEKKTKELYFGSEIAKGLEDGTIVIPNLILYPVKEEQIRCDVKGVPFYAYIDQFWPQKLKLRETKTGKHAWTPARVKNHYQLDVYSLLIETKYESVDDECHLDWIITRNKVKEIEFDGHKLEGQSNEIEMVGDVVTFARVITKTERARMAILIRSVAEEISKDYAAYLRFNPSISPDSKN